MKSIQHSQGIALFVALVFLLVSTLLGVSTLRANLFNEKMTYNAVQREEALEVAEATLLAAEQIIENSNPQLLDVVLTGRDPTTVAQSCQASYGGDTGICVLAAAVTGYDGTQYDHWIDITSDSNSLNVWSNSARHRSLDNPALMNLYGLTTAPKYIIEFMGYVPVDGDADGSACLAGSVTDINIRNQVDSWPYCSLDKSLYRITALATTGNYDETRVMLQSTYAVDN